MCYFCMTDISLEEELLFGNLNIKIFKLNGLKQETGCAPLICLYFHVSKVQLASDVMQI